MLQRLYGVVNWLNDWRINRPVSLRPSEVDKTIRELRELKKKIMEVLIEFGASAVEYIIPDLKNKHVIAQYTAIEALGRIKDVKALEPLNRLLNDKDVPSSVVRDAIKKIKSPFENIDKM